MDIWEARPLLNRYHALVVVDRDGTLIEDHGGSIELHDIELKQETLSALERLPSSVCIAIATNQPGIERGHFSLSGLREFHVELLRLLEDAGIQITLVAVCPHAPGSDGHPRCGCRKPMPGMLDVLRDLVRIESVRAVMIGDREVDMVAGANAGMQAFMVGPQLKEQLRRWLDTP